MRIHRCNRWMRMPSLGERPLAFWRELRKNPSQFITLVSVIACYFLVVVTEY
jgi:hypothetical protein